MKHTKLVLGVTGGVGAGKSTILKHLEENYGARIIECDEVGRELQQPGTKVFDEIVALFKDDDESDDLKKFEKSILTDEFILFPMAHCQDEIVLADGTLNRQLIAKKIFENESLREELNKIVHPAVWDEVQKRIEDAMNDDDCKMVVIESALLVDAGYEEVVDDVWYIYADKEVRKERLKRDRDYTDEKCESIFASQKDDAFFRAHAGYVIDNSADCVNNTFKQIEEGMNKHGIL